jgi:hypothetical protein
MVIVNQTELSLTHDTGTLSAAFTPTNSSDGFYMNPEFPFTMYVDAKGLEAGYASGVWYGEGGVSTNIINNDASTHSFTVLTASLVPAVFVVIIAVLLTVFTLAVVITRKHKATSSQI